MSTIARITTKKEAAEAGAILPCPAVGYMTGVESGPGMDKISLRAASDLTLIALEKHHKHGAGERAAREKMGRPVRIMPIVRSPSGCALGGVL